jgi:FkbM family methyltransferase
MIGSVRHFAKLSLAYLIRPGSQRRLETIWGYLKITLIDKLRLRRDHVRLYGWTVFFPSARSLRQIYEEIILGRHYRPHDLTPANPRIVDAGANIGLASLYFKLLYPSARIVCFEPHPVSFAYLRRNIEANGLSDVEIHQVALGYADGSAHLHGVNLGASLDSHRQEALPEEADRSVAVKVAPLSTFLADEPCDILKLDIEGYEGVVLEEVGGALERIDQILMEYHRWPRSLIPLSKILRALEDHGHEYDLRYWGSEGAVATCVVRSWRPMSARASNSVDRSTDT